MEKIHIKELNSENKRPWDVYVKFVSGSLPLGVYGKFVSASAPFTHAWTPEKKSLIL